MNLVSHSCLFDISALYNCLDCFSLCDIAASLLKQLKQANIVKLHDIIHTKDTLMFVFEYIVST